MEINKQKLLHLFINIIQLIITIVLALFFGDKIYISVMFALISAILLYIINIKIGASEKIAESKELFPSIKESNQVTAAFDDDFSAYDIAQLDEIYSHSDEEKLINLIMLKKSDDVCVLIRSFFDALNRIGVGREMQNYLATNLIRTFVKLISNIKVADVGEFRFENLLKIIKLNNVEEMTDSLCEVATNICCEISMASSDESIAERVKRYVEQNYSNHELDVSKIGDFLKLSPSYATRLYKQETGEVLSNYINRVRVDKAKELLRMDIYRTEQIAKMVGYLDARALNRAFKRLYGVTSTQYKDIASFESDT